MEEAKFDPMSEVWKLLIEFGKIIIEALRKQAFSVILLICACAIMGLVVAEIRTEALREREKFEQRFADMEKQIKCCEEARFGLSIKLATLEAKQDLLLNQKRYR